MSEHRVGALVLAAALACPVAATSAPRLQEELPLEALVGRVQEQYQTFADLRARFLQRVIHRPGARPVQKAGTWLIRAPGRMRVTYDSPERLFVADGEAMYWYLPEDNQVQVLGPDAMEPTHTPMLYLAGAGDMRQEFLISGTAWDELLDAGNVQIRLEPKTDGARFTHLVLEVDPEAAIIERLVYFGLLGETTDYQFREIETDIGLDENLFRFTIPPGADVEVLGD